MTPIAIPEDVGSLIGALEGCGYEACAVGGCVRDSLLGKVPADWDVGTSALPEETMACFAEQHLIETGRKHGTVTLMRGGKAYEITTYRIDGAYADNRRPDSVSFVRDLKDDLARRDFTVNAMAFHPERGLTDLFGGIRDLAAGLIRCVGDPETRFREDALRIMRALRFASALGFSIEPGTAAAMTRLKALLRNIAAERIAAEFQKILVGDNAGGVLAEYLPVIQEVLPELAPPAGDLARTPKDFAVRLSLMLRGAEDAGITLRRLKAGNETASSVTRLVSFRGAELLNETQVKRILSKLGAELFVRLLEVKRAEGRIGEAETIFRTVIDGGQCFSLGGLAVNGRDLLALGIPPGNRIGEILGVLLESVISGDCPNEKTALLDRAINTSNA
ncbi:MAG: CCA tRNA nucleotidyltransferase [Oscillospiraceae bacterium]|jgi:tRNA nucleotidyltransferase (CCA-adding enzyme)|nr:CCA tRNA nucleotidyltransferase [Oscillospiraceae bacterium]